MFKLGDRVIFARPRPALSRWKGCRGTVVGIDRDHEDEIAYLDIEWDVVTPKVACSRGMYVDDEFDLVDSGLMPEAPEYYAAITGEAL